MEFKKWPIVGRESVFKKYGKELQKIDFELPDGSISDFYIGTGGRGPVCVLALTKNQEVILAKQFRPGPYEVLLELPGGGIDPDEEPLAAIKRELLEETGYQGNFTFVTQALESAYNTVDRYCFVATDCEKVAEPQNTATEMTEVVLMPLDEFRAHLRSGRLTDIATGYLGLDYLGLL